MKKIIFFIFAGIFLISNSNTYGQNSRWKFLTTISKDKVYKHYFIDTSSIKNIIELGTNKYKCWAKIIYDGDEKIDYALHYVELDCRNETIKLLTFTMYYLDGKFETINGSEQPDYIIPESTGEYLKNYLCK